MNRLEFIDIPRAALGGVLLYTLLREPCRLLAQGNEVRVSLRFFTTPLRFFTTLEARIVSAACGRISPSDETGPGATEAGVVVYIDRQLAGPYGQDRNRYTKAPFIESVVEHGYQGSESPRQIYREGIERLGDFDRLTSARQDEELKTVEKSIFFRLLRTHTIEGMFCDPMHGGNAGLIGWQSIGFPGPHMDYRDDIDAHYGLPWRPKITSLAQSAGVETHGWEEELPSASVKLKK